MQAKSPSMLVAVLVTSAIALLDAWTGDRAVLLGLLIAGPLLAARVPQPGDSLDYELLTGHPERQAGELVFVADLTVELRAWPHDTWAKLGVDPDQIAQPVIGCWQARRGDRAAARRPCFEEARSLTRPAMTCVRGRLTARLARAHRRWLHPTSGRRPGDRFP